MPSYYFDYRNERGELERDELGIELPDVETAYLEAHRAAIDIAAEARREELVSGASFDIRDTLDRIMLELPFNEALGIREKDVEVPRAIFRAARFPCPLLTLRRSCPIFPCF